MANSLQTNLSLYLTLNMQVGKVHGLTFLYCDLCGLSLNDACIQVPLESLQFDRQFSRIQAKDTKLELQARDSKSSHKGCGKAFADGSLRGVKM